MNQGHRPILALVTILLLLLVGPAVRRDRAAPPLAQVRSSAWAATAAAYVCPTRYEAEVMAMELSGELRAPASLFARLYADLSAVRDAYPAMRHVCHTPSWAPGVLIVTLTPVAWDEFLADAYDGLDDLNARYGPVTRRVLNASIRSLRLDFATPYNPVPLAALYAAASGVESAHADTTGESSSWIAASGSTYTFYQGWGDCTDGCLKGHAWTFDVSGQQARLVDVTGDAVEGSLDVVLSEVAWAGTAASASDEWIELYNHTPRDVDLTGWTLKAIDGTPAITLSGVIPAQGHFLLERTDDDAVPAVPPIKCTRARCQTRAKRWCCATARGSRSTASIAARAGTPGTPRRACQWRARTRWRTAATAPTGRTPPVAVRRPTHSARAARAHRPWRPWAMC